MSRTRAAEVTAVDRHGPRPPESGEDERERPERVDVRERVEREPAREPGRRVAEAVGHPAVGDLVDRDGQQQCRDHEHELLQGPERIPQEIVDHAPARGREAGRARPAPSVRRGRAARRRRQGRGSGGERAPLGRGMARTSRGALEPSPLLYCSPVHVRLDTALFASGDLYMNAMRCSSDRRGAAALVAHCLLVALLVPCWRCARGPVMAQGRRPPRPAAPRARRRGRGEPPHARHGHDRADGRQRADAPARRAPGVRPRARLRARDLRAGQAAARARVDARRSRS